jgi:hypothetical protein
MWSLKNTAGYETVTVSAHGRVLERMSFATTDEAEAYKRHVRRWAMEKGVIVGVWSQRDPMPGIWLSASAPVAQAV